jgi:hypothetical protein
VHVSKDWTIGTGSAVPSLPKAGHSLKALSTDVHGKTEKMRLMKFTRKKVDYQIFMHHMAGKLLMK